jgi:hypothetical protein
VHRLYANTMPSSIRDLSISGGGGLGGGYRTSFPWILRDDCTVTNLNSNVNMRLILR